MEPAQAINPSRKKWGLGGLAFVWLGVGALATSVSAGDTFGAVASCLVLVLPGSYALWIALRNRAQFVLDTAGLTLGSGRRVEWAQVETLRLTTHQRMFGEDRSLIVRLRPAVAPETNTRFVTTNETATDELDLPLDGLSLRWEEAVRAVERYSGMSVGHARRGAFGASLDG